MLVQLERIGLSLFGKWATIQVVLEVPMRKALLLGILGAIVADTVGYVVIGECKGKSLGDGPRGTSHAVAITYPYDGALFPPESVPPTFTWSSERDAKKGWRFRATFAEGKPFETVVRGTAWTPDARTWKRFKARSSGRPVDITVEEVSSDSSKRRLAKGAIRMATSTDPVGAPLFYREVPLPFIDAVKDPSRIRWRFGTIDTQPAPPVVLSNLPVCGNCHSFSADGAVLGMDVDYANDKGSYVITETAKKISLDKSSLITWSDYKREDKQPTFGLLSQVSPDGRFAISTVKDRSVFVPKQELAFSQLFFPLKGILAFYDRKTGAFKALPGADDPAYVHSNPTWSPDGKYLVFARSKAYELKRLKDDTTALLTPEECQEFLEGGKLFRFDLYRIPFNGGKGGKALPLKGASKNGRSNYFAKYSPDGKWIVYCRADSFMLLQPDSELFIIPAGGGKARRLEANLGRMNSWHTWSPNGRWLVFSSKADTPYTQLFITHIGETGHSTPPVSLSHLSKPDRAANIPEFVNLPKGAITAIKETFVDDASFMRTAEENTRNGDFEGALKFLQKALAVNPKNAKAHAYLGGILLNQGELEDAKKHLNRAIELNPKESVALFNLGNILASENRNDEALKSWKKAVLSAPDFVEAYNNMAIVQVSLGREEEAEKIMKRGIAKNPKSAEARTNLGRLLFSLGREDEAMKAWQKAVELDDMYFDAHLILSVRMLEEGNFKSAIRHLKGALRVRPKDIECLMNLAASYAETGDKKSAVKTITRALRVAKAEGNKDLQQECEARLRQYRD
jgi:tetratricopeptide (TPR) repeat protein